MNSKSEAEKRINAFLTTHKAEVDEMLKNSSNPETKMDALYDYLQRVDSAVQERREAIAEAERFIKSNAVNVYNVAQTSGIARKTLYNNPLLVEYVKERAEEGSEESALEAVNATNRQLRDDIKEVKRQMDVLLAHEAKSEDLRVEVEQLTEELHNAQAVNQGLTEQLEEMVRQNAELKKKLSSKVVPFDDEHG